MVYNDFIKCEVCGSITRIRLQVGWLDEHPIAVTCGKCGISLKGKVHIGQDRPELSFEFENAGRITALPTTVPDYVVECSGEFTTVKQREGWVLQDEYITPFIRFQQKMGTFENYERFGKSIAILRRTADSWAQYKRILQLYEGGNTDYLIQEIKKVFPEDLFKCRNELEIIRAVRMVEVHGFISAICPEILEYPEMGSSVLKLDKEMMEEYISYLNSHDGYSLRQMQEQINKLLDEFVDVYQYLIPAFSLHFCDDSDINFDGEGTTTSTFSDVKQFYLNVYETLGNLLIIPFALDNIKSRRNVNSPIENDVNIVSLDKFINAPKASRFHLYSSDETYMQSLKLQYNQKLRNAIGHNDVKYDNVTQNITYIPDPQKRDKKLSEYLLEFEIEALSMFRAILVISEYLYRLRELELIYSGVEPLPQAFPNVMKSKAKIYPNEMCPCGSGKKYKRCHGKP